METKDLRKKYEEACNAYLTKFIKKHDYQLEPYPWVGDEVGGVACIGDMFVGFNDIRYDIDHDVPEEYFDKWYWRSVEMYEAHLDYINYPSYCKGAPDPYDEEKIKKVRELEDKIRNFELEINDLTGKNVF